MPPGLPTSLPAPAARARSQQQEAAAASKLPFGGGGVPRCVLVLSPALELGKVACPSRAFVLEKFIILGHAACIRGRRVYTLLFEVHIPNLLSTRRILGRFLVTSTNEAWKAKPNASAGLDTRLTYATLRNKYE